MQLQDPDVENSSKEWRKMSACRIYYVEQRKGEKNSKNVRNRHLNPLGRNMQILFCADGKLAG